MTQHRHCKRIAVILWLAVSSLALSAIAAAPVHDDDDSSGAGIQAGYAIVTPTSLNKNGLVVFETFGERRSAGAVQAGVLPSTLTTKSMLFVSSSGRLSRNLGVAIANPSDLDIPITLDLKDAAGLRVASKSIVLPRHQQSARFVTELFADQPSVVKDFLGTLTLSSTQPFAVVGLRFRGENFSTLPATNLAPPADIPLIGGVGGPGSVILAHFAAGGGWNSEIVIANTSEQDIVVRLDLFKQDGTLLVTSLNGQSSGSFTGISIKAGGLAIMAPVDKHGDSVF